VKILDRYVLITFLKNYVISLTVLVGLYIMMDMVFHFNDIISVQQGAAAGAAGGTFAAIYAVVNFYFYQAFLIYVQLSGIIPVVAAAFTLLRLSRFNELTAFLSAGVPLLRVAVPITVAAVFLNALLIVDQELVLPHMISQLSRKNADLYVASVPWFPIRAMQVDRNSLLLAARYHPAVGGEQPYMEDIDLLERDDNLEPVAHLYAAGAEWNPIRRDWKLTAGYRITGLRPHETPSEEKQVDYYKGDVTPDEIALYHSSEYVELLSTSRINELLARPKSYGAAGLYKVKHLRVTQPFMNVILVLLAIPMVITHDPKMLKTAAMKCLILTGLAMGSVFVAQQMAANPPAGNVWISAWPALMAWSPILIFGPLAALLLDRVRT
jgi:lipopolysaccharide export system permease protein